MSKPAVEYTGRIRRAGGHSYRLDGSWAPSVSAIKGIVSKDALVGWAAKSSAAYAIDNWEELSKKPLSQRYQEIESARFEVSREAKERGTRIHKFAEDLGKRGEAQPPPAILPYVRSYARFLDEWEFETLAAEEAVANTDYRYVGTFDVIGRCPRLGTCLLDLKTGNRIYWETYLQLLGYRYANLRMVGEHFKGPRGGARIRYSDAPMIETDGAWTAQIMPDGVLLRPVDTEPDDFDAFLYALGLYTARERGINDKRDDYDPPIGEPVFPEQFDYPDDEEPNASE